MSSDLHPEHAVFLGSEAWESLLGQRGGVAWLYGLSGSGKSTLAAAAERALYAEGRLVRVLDGDHLRGRLNRDLGFSDDDRVENLRRAAEVARLFAESGLIVLCSFISPTRATRAAARAIIGADRFVEVYVKASYETCASRDVKGLYAKAASGQVRSFTGRDSGFEEPEPGGADLVLDTEVEDREVCADRLVGLLRERFAVTAPRSRA